MRELIPASIAEWLPFAVFTWLLLIMLGWAYARYVRWKRVAKETSFLWLIACYVLQGSVMWMAMLLVGPHPRFGEFEFLRQYTRWAWFFAAITYTIALIFELRFLRAYREYSIKNLRPPPGNLDNYIADLEVYLIQLKELSTGRKKNGNPYEAHD